MFTLEGPHIVMSRTDAQNGLETSTLISKAYRGIKIQVRRKVKRTYLQVFS
jgi:hypothetical protein